MMSTCLEPPFLCFEIAERVPLSSWSMVALIAATAPHAGEVRFVQEIMTRS